MLVAKQRAATRHGLRPSASNAARGIRCTLYSASWELWSRKEAPVALQNTYRTPGIVTVMTSVVASCLLFGSYGVRTSKNARPVHSGRSRN